MQSALRTIVFCNKIETCRKVENVIKRASPQGEQGTLVLPYHAAIEEGQRVKNLKVDPRTVPCLERNPVSIENDLLQKLSLTQASSASDEDKDTAAI